MITLVIDSLLTIGVMVGSKSIGALLLRIGWPKTRVLEEQYREGWAVVLGAAFALAIISGSALFALTLPSHGYSEYLILNITTGFALGIAVATVKRKLFAKTGAKVRVEVPKGAIAVKIASEKAVDKLVSDKKFIKVTKIEKNMLDRLREKLKANPMQAAAPAQQALTENTQHGDAAEQQNQLEEKKEPETSLPQKLEQNSASTTTVPAVQKQISKEGEKIENQIATVALQAKKKEEEKKGGIGENEAVLPKVTLKSPAEKQAVAVQTAQAKIETAIAPEKKEETTAAISQKSIASVGENKGFDSTAKQSEAVRSTPAAAFNERLAKTAAVPSSDGTQQPLQAKLDENSATSQVARSAPASRRGQMSTGLAVAESMSGEEKKRKLEEIKKALSRAVENGTVNLQETQKGKAIGANQAKPLTGAANNSALNTTTPKQVELGLDLGWPEEKEGEEGAESKNQVAVGKGNAVKKESENNEPAGKEEGQTVAQQPFTKRLAKNDSAIQWMARSAPTSTGGNPKTGEGVSTPSAVWKKRNPLMEILDKKREQLRLLRKKL